MGGDVGAAVVGASVVLGRTTVVVVGAVTFVVLGLLPEVSLPIATTGHPERRLPPLPKRGSASRMADFGNAEIHHGLRSPSPPWLAVPSGFAEVPFQQTRSWALDIACKS